MTSDTGSPSLPFPGALCPGIRLCMTCSTLALLPSPGHSWTLVIPSGFPVPLSVVPPGGVGEPQQAPQSLPGATILDPSLPPFPGWEAARPPSLAGKQLHPCHLSQAGKQLSPHTLLGLPVPLSVAPPRDRIRSLSRLLARPQVPPPLHSHAGRALPAFLCLPGNAGIALRGHGGHLVPALARGLFPGRQLPDIQLAPGADGDGTGGALRRR